MNGFCDLVLIDYIGIKIINIASAMNLRNIVALGGGIVADSAIGVITSCPDGAIGFGNNGIVGAAIK